MAQLQLHELDLLLNIDKLILGNLDHLGVRISDYSVFQNGDSKMVI